MAQNELILKTPPYLVPSGTPCYVRKAGSKKWHAHKTTRACVFALARPHGMTHAIFSEPELGWEMMVALAHINSVSKNRYAPRSPDQGRGVSRRKALRCQVQRRKKRR